jgi:pimeloyl-ACP methyl ester carboxylesterase
MMRRFPGWIFLAAFALPMPMPARAESPLAALGASPWLRIWSPQPTWTSTVSTTWKAVGTEQFWADALVIGHWRLQHSAVSGRWRLLDPANVERASGSEEQCRAALDQIKLRGELPRLSGRAVITLHGLGRSRYHMDAIGSYLAEQGRFTWINVSYASTRYSLDEHARSLAGVIQALEGIDEIDFVGHSLGNLVVRRYLGEAQQPEPRWRPDPRIRRMVMLGPPNQGARIATLMANVLNDHPVAKAITGPCAWALARDFDTVRPTLATPGFEFGILAGGAGDQAGLNPLLPGDDDFIVRVEETRLAGACDFRLVNCRHGALVRDAIVRQYVLAFLNHGWFTSDGERQPIILAEKAAEAAATK